MYMPIAIYVPLTQHGVFFSAQHFATRDTNHSRPCRFNPRAATPRCADVTVMTSLRAATMTHQPNRSNCLVSSHKPTAFHNLGLH